MVKVVCPSCGGARVSHILQRPRMPDGRDNVRFLQGRRPGELRGVASFGTSGDALRKARVKQGLTLSEQAAILGVAPKALNDVEFGRRRLEDLVDVGALRCKGIVSVADEK